MTSSVPELLISSVAALLIVSAVRWIADQRIICKGFSEAVPHGLRTNAFVFIGLFALLGRLSLLGVEGVPRPLVVDEISYLFMADTFTAGRLTNPPHPLWTHFEPIFILSHPTYASVYPVAQGLVLAAGKVFIGNYWSGLLISSALMFAAICWMLQSWFPVRWAVLGSLFAVFQFGLTGYWINSYWGGCHATLGGALVLGACRRMEFRKKVRDSLILGIGLAILANSRPYEGLVLGVAVFGLFLLRSRRFGALLPAAIVLACSFAGMFYYFSRVTGSPLRMPSQVYADQYAIVPIFIWQKLRPEPRYYSKEIRDAMRSAIADYQRYSSPIGVARTTAWKILSVGNFLLGPLVLLPILMLPWLLRSRKPRRLILCCAAVFAAIAAVVPFEIHYGAPVACAVIALNTECLRRLWIARRYGNPVGHYLVPAAPVLVFMLTAFSITKPLPTPRLADRFALENQLRAAGGSHLVFVHYDEAHPLSNEWVFNGPRIDSQTVVWARDQGKLNDELIRYFPERRVWIVDPDKKPIRAVALQ
jgi:hypothetical protein